MTYPKYVSIVEVGPRDGLQNEATPLSIADKVAFINGLAEAGCQRIEAGSFVSPRWVPQMADSAQVFQQITRRPGVIFSGLTPNLTGLEAAINCGVDEVAIFGAASETFTQRNINCSIAQSIERFKPVLELAHHHNIPVRGYVSTVLGCPYEGEIPIANVVNIATLFHELGCYEISLGDTIGVGTPLKTKAMLSAVLEAVPVAQTAVHFHNTYGQALANVLVALELGIANIDSSAGGLGGCPYATGASGNLATEDLVYMLNGMGIKCGINLDKLVQATRPIFKKLDKQSTSSVHLTIANRPA